MAEKIVRITGACPARHFPEPRAFSIIIPRTVNPEKETDRYRRRFKTSHLESAAREMSDHFRGVTIDRAVQGCWWNDPLKLFQCEDNIRMTSIRNYTERDGETLMKRDDACRTWQDDVDEVNRIANKYGEHLGQGAIFATVTPLEAAQIPGRYNADIPHSFTQRSLWRFGKASDKLKFD